MLKIRRPLGRLIFNMGIAIPGKTVFLIETAPRNPVMSVFNSFTYRLLVTQGLYSLSRWTSHRKILWSLWAARFGFRLFQSLWNLIGTSAAVLPRCLSNFRSIQSSAVQRRSPGRQMRPVNVTGNPYLHLEWSVLRLINFRRIFSQFNKCV